MRNKYIKIILITILLCIMFSTVSIVQAATFDPGSFFTAGRIE
jgi:hypothetical protein